ncbi:unnamed protein product [Ectocarpus sp. CCAP 1310/34]|nr:unnamed protein product [Ectocarpus sp. CCAP 1310/34]
MGMMIFSPARSLEMLCTAYQGHRV